MNVIDELYELITRDNTIATFNNYANLFQEFYYHNMSINYGGRKVIKIYEYLLSLNINENHETMPYINSKIFQDFNNYENKITQSVYSVNTKVDDNYIEMLFKLIENYDKFKLYKNQSELYRLLDDNTFIRDYTGAMIVILNSVFFKISNQNINRMMGLIKNNSYLEKIIDDGIMGNRLLDKDYIFQYVSRFLFNAEFVNSENIKNDILISSIKESKFRDKITLEKIFKHIDIYFLLEAFDESIISLLDILEKSFDDELDRVTLFKIVYDKIKKEENFRLLMGFIMNDSRCDKYIEEKDKEFIINGFCNNYPVEITEEEIKFILGCDRNELFLINLKSDCKENNWSEETKKLVDKVTENIKEYDYDFNISIQILNSLFTGSRRVDFSMLLGSLKSLIKFYMQNENVKIYVINNDKINGCAFTEYNCINLNYNMIKKLLYTRDYEANPETLHILETAFHEARHLQQYQYIKQENIDVDIYNQYKEQVLLNICSRYYQENYVGVLCEKDARIIGAQMVVFLLQQYFPYMEKSIGHYTRKVINEKSKEEENKKIFELSEDISIDDALGKLLSINPSLIRKYSALIREYNLDGSKRKKNTIDLKTR